VTEWRIGDCRNAQKSECRARAENAPAAMLHSSVRITRVLLAVSLAVALNPAAWTQQSTPVSGDAFAHAAASRVELTAGYSYFNPSGAIAGFPYQRISAGSIYGSSYFFNRKLGVQADASFYPQSANDGDQTFSAGPVFRYPGTKATPFIHLLMGGTRLTGPNVPSIGGTSYFYNGCHWGAAVTAGGGVDYAVPQLYHRIVVRILQADYQFMQVNYGPLTATGGGTASLNSLRLSSGVVLRWGRM